MKKAIQGEVSIRKLTKEDVPLLNGEGQNGPHLVEYGYYKISLVEDPEIYCYARDFGGLKCPEDVVPYLYIDSGSFGDFLRIDIAAIKNDETRNIPMTIPVVFIEEVRGENTKIFRNPNSDKYYMRISSYPREKFARWMTTYKKGGRWEDVAEIRPNVIFDLNGETEKVTYTNWNGPAVYENEFNEEFEKVDEKHECN